MKQKIKKYITRFYCCHLCQYMDPIKANVISHLNSEHSDIEIKEYLKEMEEN